MRGEAKTWSLLTLWNPNRVSCCFTAVRSRNRASEWSRVTSGSRLSQHKCKRDNDASFHCERLLPQITYYGNCCNQLLDCPLQYVMLCKTLNIFQDICWQYHCFFIFKQHLFWRPTFLLLPTSACAGLYAAFWVLMLIQQFIICWPLFSLKLWDWPFTPVWAKLK